MDKLDTFTQAFIIALLWSTIDGDEPLDQNFDINDIAPETMEKIKTECKDFQTQNASLMDGFDPESCGHDFALTRNRHGAGFWDRGYGAVGDQLTEACHAFGEFNLYVGDDKLLYA